jgi:hypothetical protein
MSGPQARNVTTVAIIFEGGLVLAAWGLGWAVGFPIWSEIQVSWRVVGLAVVETLPLLLLAWWSLHSDWPPLARLAGTIEELVAPMFAGSPVYALACVSILAGVGEEALFRGVLQDVFGEWLGVWGGLAITSGLFGLAHFVTAEYAILAGLIGVYLGSLALAHQNLAAPMLIHALYDFVALTYLVSRLRRRSKSPEPAAVS